MYLSLDVAEKARAKESKTEEIKIYNLVFRIISRLSLPCHFHRTDKKHKSYFSSLLLNSQMEHWKLCWDKTCGSSQIHYYISINTFYELLLWIFIMFLSNIWWLFYSSIIQPLKIIQMAVHEEFWLLRRKPCWLYDAYIKELCVNFTSVDRKLRPFTCIWVNFIRNFSLHYMHRRQELM